MSSEPEFVDLTDEGKWPDPALEQLWKAAQQHHASPRRTYSASDPMANFRSGKWGTLHVDGRER